MGEALPSIGHVVERAGHRTEIWIDAQVSGTERYSAQAFSVDQGVNPSAWVNEHAELRNAGARIGRATNRAAGHFHVTAFGLQRALLGTGGTLLRDQDIIHAHFGPIGALMSKTADRLGIPLVTSFYGYDAFQDWVTSPRWAKRYRQLFETVGAVIVEGPAFAEQIVALGCPADRVHVIRLPFANTELVVERSDPQYAAVMAGRFVEKKGFDDGIRAFGKAARRGERLLIVGSGPMEPRLRSVVHELALDDQVNFVSDMSLTELARVIQSARTMLFPSRRARNGDSEGGAPVVLTMAQALEVPVVITDHADLPFAAAPGTPATAEGAVDAFAGSLRAVLDDATSASRQAKTAREFVEREHETTHLVRSREAVYDLVRS